MRGITPHGTGRVAGAARRFAVRAAAVLAGISLAPGDLRAQVAGERSRIDASLAVALTRASPSDTLPVIVQYRAPAAPPPPAAVVVPWLQRVSANALAPLAAVEDRAGADLNVRQRLWIVPAAVGVATPSAVAALAADPAVARVYLDERIRVSLEQPISVAEPSFTSAAMQTVGADVVWDQGATGAGTTVAFFDSGVDIANAMVASRWRGNRTSVRAGWFDPFLQASMPQDVIGHGTQVAAAAVGALASGDTLWFPDGSFVVASSPVDVVTGSAPGAEWIAARVFERFGSEVYTRRSVLLQAFQWALDPDANPTTADAPDVINNSWGLYPGAADFDPCNDVLYAAIDAAEAAGIAVLFSAGNTGPGAGSVTPPGARDDAALRSMAVGATQGTVGPTVPDYSGRGPSPCGGGIKPELVAPGNVPQVVANSISSARLTGFAVTGTSFSTAITAGALALVLQARPSADPEEAKRILLDTADDLPPAGPDNDSGSGLLNVPAAVQRANSAFAGGLLQVVMERRTADSLHLVVTNRGSGVWEGGEAWIVPDGSAPVARRLPVLPPAGETRIAVAAAGDAARSVRVAVTDLAGVIVLSRVLISGPPNLFGGFILETGELAAGGNDFGRFGRIAAFRGFEWRGTELLPAGALGIASGGRLSDGMYTTTLGRTDLKSSPPAAETDWRPSRSETEVGETAAEYRFDDLQALAPIGLEVQSVAAASEQDGVAALTVTVSIQNLSGGALTDVTPAMLADWDLPGGETIRWSDPLEALVAESVDGDGPLTVLASEGAIVGRVSVPLGTPAPGSVYQPDSGVLWDEFAESDKLSLVTGGSAAGLPGFTTATDRAALLSAGPLTIPAGESRAIRFWLLAADTEAQAAARLSQLRDEPIVPPGPDDEFAIQPPFPNPLRTGAAVMRFPYSVPDAARAAGSTLVFEIYDVAGRRLVQQSHRLSATGELPQVVWDGYLAGGLEAASGAYLYVFRLNDATRSGRIMVVH